MQEINFAKSEWMWKKMRALYTFLSHIIGLGNYKVYGTMIRQNLIKTSSIHIHLQKLGVTMFPLLFDPGAVRSSTLLHFRNSKSFNTRINMPIDIVFCNTVFLGAGVIKYYEYRHCLSLYY